MPTSIKDECAIVGIGQTEFSENSGRSELQLTVECVKAAIEDAGIALSDIDGMVTFTTDGSDEIAVMRGLGSEEAITELYLTILSRFPTEEELQVVKTYGQAGSGSGRVLRDLAWALINNPEFSFRH